MIAPTVRSDWRMSQYWARWVPSAAMVGTGCGGTTEVLTPPPPPPTAFSVRLVADPEDSASARALGWSAELPAADVVVTPSDSSRPPVTLQTAASGDLPLSGVPVGDYEVRIARWLTPTEVARLPLGDNTIGFATTAALRVATTGSDQVAVPASRRRGLVISEHGFNYLRDPVAGYYPYGGYLELYNNADTTIYPDGMLVGQAYSVDNVLLSAPATPSSPSRMIPTFSGLFNSNRSRGRARLSDRPVRVFESAGAGVDASTGGTKAPSGGRVARRRRSVQQCSSLLMVANGPT